MYENIKEKGDVAQDIKSTALKGRKSILICPFFDTIFLVQKYKKK